MIKYYALFDLLNRRNMKRTDLLEVISSPTLAKLSKGQNVNTDIIDKLCNFLNCQPADIMEFYYEDLWEHEDGVVEQVKPITFADGDYSIDTKYVKGPKRLEDTKLRLKLQLDTIEREIQNMKNNEKK
jgi:putative transcriptional regulator